MRSAASSPHLAGREVLQAQPEDRDAAGPAARLAPAGEASSSQRQAGLRRARRFRALLLPQRARDAGPGDRALLLPAQDGVAPRGEAVERRVPARAGEAGNPARQRARAGTRRSTASPRGATPSWA